MVVSERSANRYKEVIIGSLANSPGMESASKQAKFTETYGRLLSPDAERIWDIMDEVQFNKYPQRNPGLVEAIDKEIAAAQGYVKHTVAQQYEVSYVQARTSIYLGLREAMAKRVQEGKIKLWKPAQIRAAVTTGLPGYESLQDLYAYKSYPVIPNSDEFVEGMILLDLSLSALKEKYQQ